MSAMDSTNQHEELHVHAAHNEHAHTDHGHDHHEDHHHEETFISKYVFSHDHKMISKQFLITAIFMAVIAMMMSIIFRLQLAWPGKSFPILESVLGKWAPGGVLDPNFYLALVTIHGTIMVFFVLTGGLSGTFSNLLIPLQIGARDMASGFLNMLSFWFFAASSPFCSGPHTPKRAATPSTSRASAVSSSTPMAPSPSLAARRSP
jgi:cbb3-type cytochrome oxidase subunit 1